jgi:hypothetical protein
MSIWTRIGAFIAAHVVVLGAVLAIAKASV